MPPPENPVPSVVTDHNTAPSAGVPMYLHPVPPPQNEPGWKKALDGDFGITGRTQAPLVLLPCQQKLSPCCVKNLTVKCGHSRSFRINAAGDKKTRGGAYVLQVIGDSQETLAITLGGGPCKRGRPSAVGIGSAPVPASYNIPDIWPAVTVAASGVDVRTAAPFRVAAPNARWSGGIGPWSRLFSAFSDFPGCATTYSIAVACCEGGDALAVTVESFPEFQVGGSIELAYKLARSDEDVPRPKERNTNEEGAFLLIGSIQGAVGESKFKISTPSGRDKKPDLPFRTFPAMMDRFLPTLNFFKKKGGKAGVSATLNLPSIKLDANLSAREKADSWRVTTEGTFKLRLDPLIGATIDVDILHILIEWGPVIWGVPKAVTKVLIKARDWCETGIKKGGFQARAAIGINWITSGNINGSFEWRNLGSGWEVVESKLDIPIEMVIKGKGEFEARYLVIGASGAIELGAKGKIGIRGEAIAYGDRPGVKGAIYCDGVTVYFLYELNVGRATEKRKLTNTAERDLKRRAKANPGLLNPKEGDLYDPGKRVNVQQGDESTIFTLVEKCEYDLGNLFDDN